MKVLVTGGCGFIGSHLVDALVKSGHEVTVIDDLSADNNGFYTNDKVKYAHIDICDHESICRYFCGVDHVFHLAADARIQPSILNPDNAVRVNVTGTLSILKACVKNSVKRITYSSTSAIYGLTERLPIDEVTPYDCLNPYAATKLAGEELVKCYTRMYGIDSCVFRYFNVFGERSPVSGPYSLVIGIFLSQRSRNVPLTVVGDGESLRDFIYVGDVVDVNLLSMTHKNRIDGAVFNIGYGKNVSIINVAKSLSDNIEYIERRIGEAKVTLCDNKKARATFGWNPSIWLLDWLKRQ